MLGSYLYKKEKERQKIDTGVDNFTYTGTRPRLPAERTQKQIWHEVSRR